MTPRVTLPNPDTMTPDEKAVYERFQSNLSRALLLTAGSAAPHLALGASFTVGALELVDREVIVLRVANLLDSDFEKMLHYPLARKAGLTDTDIADIETAALDRLEPRRAAIVDYVTDCTIDHKASDRTFWKLREFLSEREIADATHLAGHCAMTAMYLASLDIPLDTTDTSWSRLTELRS